MGSDRKRRKVTTYPETIQSAKVELKSGPSGKQYLYLNGHRFMEFDSLGFKTIAGSANMKWDLGRGVLTGTALPVARIRFETISSYSGKGFYRLTIVDRKATACTCKAFEFHSTCKHIDDWNATNR